MSDGDPKVELGGAPIGIHGVAIVTELAPATKVGRDLSDEGHGRKDLPA